MTYTLHTHDLQMPNTLLIATKIANFSKLFNYIAKLYIT
jgi:hypothetical protein